MFPEIQTFVGGPVTLPFLPALYYYMGYALDGDLQPPTKSKITLTTADGHKIVFKGDFTVTGGDVTGGTMTKFTVFAGSTKVVEGSGYDVDAAALFDALQTYGTDSSPFNELVLDQPTKYVGSEFDDTLYSMGDVATKLIGRGGNDVLVAASTDGIVIKGGSGDDLIAAAEGPSKLWGGPDDDVFGLFFDPMDPPTSIAKIKDFVPGEDLIGLQAADGFLPPGFLDKSHFHKGTEATKASHVVIYDKDSGKVYIDVDGSGVEAQFQIAKVTPGTKLGAGDFYVDFGLGIA
ncbi:MAG: calcium-binding protein [Bauldia sp.]|nr:calcium-binding protein [Bauldia sp.]